MKRKIRQALVCTAILSLIMTGCGNAVTTSAEPGAAADKGQKTGASVGADSKAVEDTSAESRVLGGNS